MLTLGRVADQNRFMSRFLPVVCLVASMVLLLRGMQVILKGVAVMANEGASAAYAQGYLHGQAVAGWMLIAAAAACALIAWQRVRAKK
ncbi:hypothetical protein D7Y55_17020 [Stenotrophomonas maltophilia]|nr:hypothetical protein VN11_14110 [Stenotrophomonas maltophilia]MBA0436282.1 hypothetical protein [Stenotrophomonas maltophilia]